MSFIQSADIRTLLFYLEGRELVAALQPPAHRPKSRAVYFLKPRRQPLNAEHPSRDVIFGELAESPLDQLAALSAGVFVPLLGGGEAGAMPAATAQGLADLAQHLASTGERQTPTRVNMPYA